MEKWGENPMDKRRELKEQYKARKVVGGVYRIVNKENGQFLLQSTDDMQSARNLFQFFQLTDACTLPAIREDWKRCGKEAFALEELEELEKKEEQTTAQFREDLEVLLELWSEKLPVGNRY